MHRGHTVGTGKPKEGLIERRGSKDKQEIYLDRTRMHTGHAVRTGTSKEGLTERTASRDKHVRYSDRISKGMHTRHILLGQENRMKD